MAAAAMVAAMMLAAGTMLVVMMVAMHIGIVAQGPGQVFVYPLVRRAAHSAHELDSGLSQRNLGAAADSAADQQIHALGA